MHKKILAGILPMLLLQSIAMAQFPYTGPDAWHDIELDGKVVKIAEYDGMAVIEGDIVLGPIRDVLAGNHRALFRRNLWLDGIVGYTISPSMPSGNVSNILSAIAHIEAVTSIVFEERNTGDYINFNPSSNSCSSYVGRQGGAQGIALAPACNRGNTVHEIIHALGFHHEHQRPDRDMYITVDLAQACLFTGSNFAIIDRFSSDQLGPYDYGSIMHYFWNTFSCTGQPTIIGPPGVPLGSFFDMSEHDALAIEWLYFAPEYSTDDDGDDVENADDLCLEISDLAQVDSDNDGFGNLCDPDLNNDGIVNAADLGMLKSRFFGSDPDADFDGDGAVNAADLGVMKNYFFQEPGPSGRTPGKAQILGTPTAVNQGDGTVSIDVSWSTAAGLPHEYVVEADSGVGYVEVCRTAEESCSASGISDAAGSSALRVRAIAPYGNEGANSSVVVVSF